MERLGSEYGGWWIPRDCVTSASIAYSAGVGEDASFDLALIESRGCEVWAFDPTPRAVAFAGSIADSRFHFLPCGLAAADGVQQFYGPANPEHASHSFVGLQSAEPSFSAECLSLASLTTRLGHSHVDLLKLDVEGAEYEILEALGEIRPRILCVEFHSNRSPKEVARLVGDAGYAPLKVEGRNVTMRDVSREVVAPG